MSRLVSQDSESETTMDCINKKETYVKTKHGNVGYNKCMLTGNLCKECMEKEAELLIDHVEDNIHKHDESSG